MTVRGGETVALMKFAFVEGVRNDTGLVVGKQCWNFSAGGNIMMFLPAAQEEEWDDINMMIRGLQNSVMRLRYSPKPVVTAPYGLTLGGGCEISMHGDRVQAAAETYIGLVEVGDNAVFERPDCDDVARGAPKHSLRFLADGKNLAALHLDGDDRGLAEENPPAAHVDERIRRSEVYTDGARKAAGQQFEKVHKGIAARLPCWRAAALYHVRPASERSWTAPGKCSQDGR